MSEDNIKVVLARNLEAALRRRDLARARDILARRQAIDPLSLETRGLELELLLEEGNLADAEALAATLERYLERHPGDRFAKPQRLKLRARAATPEELAEEVHGLGELGEPVAPALLEAHVDALPAQGRTSEAGGG